MDEEEARAALEALEQEGLLSERRFAEGFVHSRAARGDGPVKIRHQMLERGLDSETAADALDDSGVDWRVVAAQARTKRFGVALPSEYEERARQSRFLERRGFGAAEIRFALSQND